MKWICQLFRTRPRGGFKTARAPDPEPIRLGPGPFARVIGYDSELLRNARAERRRQQFVMDELIKRTKRPERTLRYFAVMARRELHTQQVNLKRAHDRLVQLEQALDVMEESLNGPRKKVPGQPSNPVP